MWETYKKGYKAWLQLEKSLSDHSVEAYIRDVDKLTQYLSQNNSSQQPGQVTLADLQKFLKWISEFGLTASSQARMISGIRSFYKYCLTEEIVTQDPTLLLEAPK